MATKELINFKSRYEEINDTAQPANYQNRTITKEAETRINEFRKRKLGQAALGILDLSQLAA
ncbi:hypothetical protein IJG90_01855 [Candidatus Saccharibacteria bacterium]|nr:hypothetical protein [Candidatus Saccharibacteria bacterium]